LKIVTELFYQLLVSSAAAVVLACLILLLKRIFRRKLEAKWHYYIWFLLVIKLLLPYTPESNLSMFNVITPVIQQVSDIEAFYPSNDNVSTLETKNESKVQPKNKPMVVEEIKNNKNTVSADNAPDETNTVKSNSDGNENKYQNVLHILFFVWLTGLVLLIGFTIYGNLKFRKNIHPITLCTDKRINGILDKCSESTSVRRKIPIFQIVQARAPLLYGLINPKILISTGFVENFSDDELKYILLHELSHYKRKDILTNWIITILQLIHWFNPMVWYSFYIMRQDCEIACDARVLSGLKESERNEYGQTIINLLKVFTESYFIPSSAGVVKGKSGLKRRITMISVFKKKSWFSALGAVVLIAAVAIVGLPNAKLLANSDQVIHFKDSNIQAAVEKALKKQAGSILTKSDIKKIKELNINKVTYADEIQYCTSLESLQLEAPLDLKLLGNIKNLKTVGLGYDVSNLDDLRYCKNLGQLSVGNFTGQNTNTFANLKGLKKLSIGFKVRNPDLSGLKSLKQLKSLGFFPLEGKSNLNELSSLKQLESLALVNCPDLENIEALSFLSYLSIWDKTKLTNESLSALSKFKNLRKLYIEYIDIKNLKPFEQLVNLESLSIVNSQIKDINSLKNLVNLTTLNLGGNRISDISALKNMKKLKEVELVTNQIKNIEPLRGLKSIETLKLERNLISSVGALSGLTALQSLSIWENKIADISPLSGLANLTELKLSNNKIKDIKPLSALYKIKELDLSENKIADISSLSNFARLENIRLRRNQIKIIGQLNGLNNIKAIDLSDNNISDIRGLSGLTALKEINLSLNKITDVSPLATLKNLTELNISNNEIKDIKPLSALAKVKELFADNNQISDISILTRFPALESIGLGSNNINEKETAVLAGLSKLKFIGLANNKLSDISFLKSLVNIDCLNLSQNRISDINVIAGMKGLRTLYLQDNQITDIAVLGGLAKLDLINLSNNKITDVRPLANKPKDWKGWLILKGNNIKDYSPISSFYNPADDKDD
jgi:Leucine-rich repeat (LRR) protein